MKSNATCTNKAVYYKSCSCGKTGTSTFESGSTLNHTYNNEVATSKYLKSNATCTSKAVYYKSCSCGKVGTSTFEYGSKNPHNIIIDIAVSATCDKTGLTEGSHCSVCKEILVNQEIIQKTKHNYTSTECTICHIISPSYIVSNATSSGKYSSNAYWYLYDNNLVITGSGNMTNYSMYSSYPWWCYSLKRVIIANGITSIADDAFSYQRDLVSVEILGSITKIGNSAFDTCTSLETITLPSTVTSLGYWAFDGCTKLSNIVFDGKLTTCLTGALDGTAYYNDLNNWDNGLLYFANILIAVKDDLFGDVYINKSGVTNIPPMLFEYNTKIENVYIHEGITSIGYCAFQGCTSLKTITIPKSLTTLSDGLFEDCTSLRTIYYAGTKAEWEAIYKRNSWDDGTYLLTIICSDGEI